MEILPLALIATLYFAGSIEMGVVSQSSEAFWKILKGLSIIFDAFYCISAFSAGVDSLGELGPVMYDCFFEKEESSSRDGRGDRGCGDDDDNVDDLIATSVFVHKYVLKEFRPSTSAGSSDQSAVIPPSQWREGRCWDTARSTSTAKMAKMKPWPRDGVWRLL